MTQPDMAVFLQTLSIWILPVLFAITLHEAAHGWVASKLGDRTALMLGRVSINPIKHIDPVGTILVPLAALFLGGIIFGWAKPVPVISRNLHKPKRDMAFVAVAGPISNIFMAIFWAGVAKLSFMSTGATNNILYAMGLAGIEINLVLASLNLLPIPPLDGSRILACFLSAKLDYAYSRIEPYGFFILIGLAVFNILWIMIALPYKFMLALIAGMFGLPISG